jgi:hypothetical protein
LKEKFHYENIGLKHDIGVTYSHCVCKRRMHWYVVIHR